MSDGPAPTEEYGGQITVRLASDDAGRELIHCSSFREAIDVVKERRHAVTVAKIINRDGDVVFTSADTDIESWETVWEHEKRILGVDVQEYDCPYDNVSCFADDLCVQCKMDKLQNR